MNDRDLGRPNPKAPPELARFAFLVGRWRCEARARTPDGNWQSYRATWVGRYVLDGYVIEDEYRMTDAAGNPIVMGLNFRSYDATNRAWNVRWLDGFAGRWLDLVSAEFGGIRFEGRSLSYVFREPTAGHALTRATYTDDSPTHFTWRGEKSEDGKTWREFMVLHAEREPE